MRLKKILPPIIFLVVLGLDQSIKWWIVNYHPTFVLGNQRLFFGFVGNNSISLLISLFALVVLFLTLAKEEVNWLILGIISGGAISNIADRIFRGAVIDYFQFFFWSINLADLAITVGITLYLYQIFKTK